MTALAKAEAAGSSGAAALWVLTDQRRRQSPAESGGIRPSPAESGGITRAAGARRADLCLPYGAGWLLLLGVMAPCRPCRAR